MAPDVIIVTVLTSVGWLFIANRVWVGRHDPYLAGRVPILVCVTSFGCLAFVLATILHWIMLTEDREVPCSVLFWPAYTSEYGTRDGAQIYPVDIFMSRSGDETATWQLNMITGSMYRLV